MQLNSKMKNILEWVISIIIAIVIALLVKYYIGTPTEVRSVSMYPTLIQGQRLILNRTIRTTQKIPERGEICTFEAPKEEAEGYQVSNEEPLATYPIENNNIMKNFTYHVLEFGKMSYIKRVIGLPGEHVKIENGKVFINGEMLQEDYLQPEVTTNTDRGVLTDFIVPENAVFLMGDNRDQSHDCRAFGCIPMNKIESKVWIRIWPFDVFGKVK